MSNIKNGHVTKKHINYYLRMLQKVFLIFILLLLFLFIIIK